MRFSHREFAGLQTCRRFDSNLFDVLSREPITFAILVGNWTCRIVERFEIDVSQVSAVVGAHPAAIFVVSDVREWKPKPRITGKIPTFITMNMTFVNLARSKER